MTQRSRSDLETLMDTGLGEFLAVIDRMTEEEMTDPVDGNGWNVRDHLTHLAVWAEGIAALLQRKDRWAAMGLDMDEPDPEPDYDQLNSEIVAMHHHLSPKQARAWLIEAHQAVATAMKGLPEEELGWPYERFVKPFTGNNGEPVSEYILGNTEDHYEEHTPWVRAIVSDR